MKNVLKKVIIVYGIILGISFVASIIFIVISVTINSKKRYHWELHQDMCNIANIYIVEADNEREFKIKKSVSLEKKDELLKDIISIDYKKELAMDPGHPGGLCFVIEYIDSNYEIISCNYPKYCEVEDGVVKNSTMDFYVYEEENFIVIINKYMND